MDLKRCAIDDKFKSVYYCKRNEVVNQRNCGLLGFKRGLPVLSSAMPETHTTIDLSNKKTLLVEVNPETGEKFIKLNGKKLKMVTESQLPAHLRATAKLARPGVVATSGKKPVKIKIIGSIPAALRGPAKLIKQASELDKNVNKPADNHHSDKVSLSLIKPSTARHVSTATDVQCARCAKLMQENGTVSRPSDACTMKALDLTNTPAKKAAETTDKSVQTDECVQTDEYVQTDKPSVVDNPCPSELTNLDSTNFEDLDLSELLDFPFGTPARVEEPEKVRFFNELRTALMPDTNGNMPIHVGVLKNDLSSVKRCCKVLRALQKPVDTLNHSDLTALQLSIFDYTNPEIIKTLLRYGASLEVTDCEGNNIVHLAVQFQRQDILETILEVASARQFDLNHFNAEGLTALMICASNKFYRCAELLLLFYADLNVRDRKSGRTALFHAAENHDLDMVQLLLKYEADTKIKNFFGTSPHDAMYEVDDIPEPIKSSILARNNKRKIVEEPKPVKVRKIEEPKKQLRTYARLRKIDDFSFGKNATTLAK